MSAAVDLTVSYLVDQNAKSNGFRSGLQAGQITTQRREMMREPKCFLRKSSDFFEQWQLAPSCCHQAFLVLKITDFLITGIIFDLNIST